MMRLEFPESAKAVIQEGIKRPIRLLLENKCYPAALILTYSGIEMMAFLNLAPDKSDVTRSDFIDWAETHVTARLPQCLTGKDLYGARCSAFRGADARLVREGLCAMVRYRITSENAITISVDELVTAFFAGIDSFVSDVEANNERAVLVAHRLDQMLNVLPF